MTTTPLHVDMDSLKVGPGGQTLGELKQSVLDTRSAFVAAAKDDATTPDQGVQALMAYDSAARMLRAAYVRMGLPYVSPKT